MKNATCVIAKIMQAGGEATEGVETHYANHTLLGIKKMIPRNDFIQIRTPGTSGRGGGEGGRGGERAGRGKQNT